MQAWDEFLALQEIELGIETVHKWLRTLKVVNFDACNLYLEAKDSFQAMWFEEHIRKKVQNKLFNNNNKKIKVHLNVLNGASRKTSSTAKTAKQLHEVPFNLSFDSLDPFCTFANYIPIEKNDLAEKLLKNLSHELGVFNPIYIHGSSGTGKTHLLMATAHDLQKKGLRVLYTRLETFTEHVVSAIRSGEMSRFRQVYRNSDVLIIEDVQFLSKKSATQEELFHTFNALHLENKQMILSAHCAPAELQQIEPRLVSRFEWGVVLNLFALQKEELRKILNQKMLYLNFPLHEKVLDFLLEHFTSGSKNLIRALEALILRFHLNGKFQPPSVTVPLVKETLHDLLLEEKKYILTPDKVIQIVAENFGIKVEDIKGKIQTRDCVFPRQLAMYACRQKLKMPFTKIGELFGKDHSTVMTSVKLIQTGLDHHDKDIISAYLSIEKKFNTQDLT